MDQTERFPFSIPKSPNYKPIVSIEREVAPKIASAMMSVPYYHAQGCVEGLEKFTQQQIQEMYAAMLQCPTGDLDQTELLRTPFSLEEDIAILHYLKSNMNLEDMVARFGFVFDPTRTKKSLEQRAEFLSRLPPEKIEEIFDKFSTETVVEERFSESIMQNNVRLASGAPHHPSKEQCYCCKDIKPTGPRNPKLDDEIEQIKPAATSLINSIFSYNDLAFLMNEKIRFSMKNKFIIIGRQTDDNSMDNDIDLGLFNSLVCEHVSRLQATIQFMHNGKFYVENIGQNAFRINGDVIYPTQIAEVPDQAIFDFNNTIFIFFINHDLVNTIMKELNSEK
ncbi:hypothetical protein TRFO_08000 [Tritrichomonas foetus]|uniref:FHA domain-containing protein n=1 Tax=Tritrichomonas foetus TaxID=1144522 RepID=A0A1J4JS35_9EUKA|nr:hypothetical protein TRFO_08000 [Tritrichomonas foetus]|eukprot:OHT00332.1 hypothetical protein TRFO_08000 [Tritrichomonas foetus]